MNVPNLPSPALFLDVMLRGRFLCQLRYTKPGRLEWVGDKLDYVYDTEDLQRFVEQKRPSLAGLDYKIEFSNQKV